MFPTRFDRVTPTAWTLLLVVCQSNNHIFRFGTIHSKPATLKKKKNIVLLAQEVLVGRVGTAIINNGCLAQELQGNHCWHKGK